MDFVCKASDTSINSSLNSIFYRSTSSCCSTGSRLSQQFKSSTSSPRRENQNNVNTRGSEISSECAETLKQQAKMFENLYTSLCTWYISLRQQVTDAHLGPGRSIISHNHLLRRCGAMQQSTVVVGSRARRRKPALDAAR